MTFKYVREYGARMLELKFCGIRFVYLVCKCNSLLIMFCTLIEFCESNS